MTPHHATLATIYSCHQSCLCLSDLCTVVSCIFYSFQHFANSIFRLFCTVIIDTPGLCSSRSRAEEKSDAQLQQQHQEVLGGSRFRQGQAAYAHQILHQVCSQLCPASIYYPLFLFLCYVLKHSPLSFQTPFSSALSPYIPFHLRRHGASGRGNALRNWELRAREVRHNTQSYLHGHRT